MGINGFDSKSNPERSVYGHTPVLLDAVMAGLACRPGGRYLDCTIGRGGVASCILERSGPDGLVIGFDRDAAAIAACRTSLAAFGDRVRLLHGDFRDMKAHLQAVGVSTVHGVVFDLGVSSAQLDDPARGFSFQHAGPLDMRMDQAHGGATAADVLAEVPERDLADLMYQYGEERYARRIARAIVEARRREPIRTTQDLAAVIRGAVPAAYRHGRIHCATRTFQALRIAVNRELDGLDQAIRDAAEVLEPGGRLCVVAFHSLEDRIAKQTLRELSRSEEPRVAVLTKKPTRPSERECRENPRARSAKLRVAERLPARRPMEPEVRFEVRKDSI